MCWRREVERRAQRPSGRNAERRRRRRAEAQKRQCPTHSARPRADVRAGTLESKGTGAARTQMRRRGF